MSPTNDPQQPGPLNPQSLRLEDLARLLTVSGLRPVTVEMLQADLDDGVPSNPDGTVNLIQYAAWLVKEFSCRE